MGELAAEDGQEKGNGLHLEDPGRELEELERGRGGEHGRDHNGEKLLLLEAIADALVAFTVDALEQEELTSGAADEEGDERTDGGRNCGYKTVEQEALVVYSDVAYDDAVHRDGDGDEGGVNQGEPSHPPDAKRLEDCQQDYRKLVQKSDGCKFHGPFILPFGRFGKRSFLHVRCCRPAGQVREGVEEGLPEGSFRHRGDCPGD